MDHPTVAASTASAEAPARTFQDILSLAREQQPLLAGEPACQDIVARLAPHSSPESLERVKWAYALARVAHAGQRRRSGESYFEHPLAVVYILLDLDLDADTIAAALLHDVAEDTVIPLETIYQEFGQETGTLVDGVTKITRIEEKPLNDAQAYNLRKMFLAMSEDVRVILLKLADRLHNMRTLDVMPPEKQHKIADETMEIYAPLAHRLGIWEVKSELEDLAFQFLDSAAYHEVSRWMDSRRPSRERVLKEIVQTLTKALGEADIKAEIQQRAKGIYSTYEKTQLRGQGLDRIYDILAVRIIVGEIRDCYAALGIVHNLWRPIPGQFDDYIATPKEGVYRSLHTTVLYQGTQPLEVQIRTWEMHREAEYGIAAHWRYKEGGRVDRSFEEKLTWLRETMAWRQEVSDDREYVERVRTEVFQNRVYVFTPKGDIKDLPAGATPIDFAYSIHSQVGHRSVGARVNGRWVPLSYRLRTGDQVEVLTAKGAKGPSQDWLSFVVSPSARAHIRRWFKKSEREENVSRGREILEREFRRLAMQLDLKDLTQKMGFAHTDDMLAAIGYGDVSVRQVLSKLPIPRDEVLQELPLDAAPALVGSERPTGVSVQGQRGLLTNLARCCQPVPGDAIIGYVTRGRGVTIHRADCKNIRLAEPERLIQVDWGSAVGRRLYPVHVFIEAFDRVGLLRDISAAVADEGVNMASVRVGRSDSGSASFQLILEVASLEQLSTVLHRLSQISNVVNVYREAGNTGVEKHA
jgi:guanosine-3',5'-bis(diphosphate) 3'-pyrophosphohydrolase